MRRLGTLAAALLVLALAAPAHAGVVGDVGLGSFMDGLVAGADGGAWVLIDRPGRDAVGHAGPDGGLRTTAIDKLGFAGLLGPDGKAWYPLGPGRFLRADATGTLDTLEAPGGDDVVDIPLALGPDGAVWAPTHDYDGLWHITPDGQRTRTPATLPEPCDADGVFSAMAVASDGAIWLADRGCAQLIRVGPAGSTTLDVEFFPSALAADHAGGVWVSRDQAPSVLHVDAAGAQRSFDLPADARQTDDVALAPDGSAWFVSPLCRLVRVTPAGELTTSPMPIHATQVAVDPAGGLWLKGRARLAHLAPGEPAGTCDTRAPSLRVHPSGSSVSLRRLRAFTIAVREPAAVEAYETDSGGSTIGGHLNRIVRAPQGGTLRYRITKTRRRQLQRRLRAGRKPTMTLNVLVNDVEGNFNTKTVKVRIRP